jgi:electron transfer flavoprotein alpha subunit
MSILVIAEHENGHLKNSTLNTIKAAQTCGQHHSVAIHVLVMGHEITSLCTQISHIESVKHVLCIDDISLKNPIAERYSAQIVAIADRFSHILAPATSFGKNVLPRVAALLDVAQISDVISVQANHTYVRPIYAGNIMATVQNTSSKQLLTIRTTAFDAVNIRDGEQGGSATIESLPLAPCSQRSAQFVSRELAKSERPELSSARVVVSGGRGLGSADNFKLLEQLADRLNAAMGASRAAVDAGYVPNDWQVGQTGQVVAPQLYIAVGISGAIQHLAGMKDSKVIVAINKDPDAPIFQVADYGLVGDLFELVPQLTQALS